MQDINIKSRDLCDRCFFSLSGQHCNIICFNDREKCAGCPLLTDGKPHCKCVTVQINTPCPYFRERDDGR